MKFNEEGLPELSDGEVINKSSFDNYAKEYMKTGGWRNDITKEYATDPSMAGVTDVDTLVKNFIYTKKASGGRLYRPKEGDSQELWNEWYKQMDIPLDEKGYEDIPDIENLPEEFKATREQDRKEFIKYCNDHKITKKNAEKTWQYLQNKSSAALNKLKSDNEAAVSANRESLQKEWGAGYDENIKFVNEVMNTVDPDGNFSKWAEQKGLKSAPQMLKFIHQATQHFKEDFVKDHNLMRSNQTPIDAQIQLNQLTGDILSGKYIKGTPVYQQKLEERMRLAAKAAGANMK